MFEVFKKHKEKTELDEAIDNRIEDLKDLDDDSAEDTTKIKNLKDLVEAKEKLYGPKHKLNPNTVLSAVVTAGGIAAILVYEKTGVVTSKAMSLINKVKFW